MVYLVRHLLFCLRGYIVQDERCAAGDPCFYSRPYVLFKAYRKSTRMNKGAFVSYIFFTSSNLKRTACVQLVLARWYGCTP